MTEATIVGAWDKVRDSARRLGIELPGEDGPVDERMGLCQVRFVEADGARHDYYAERRSPVAARVLQKAGPRRPEHFDDLVVFDAGPLNPRERSESSGEGGEDEEEQWIPIFPVVHVLQAGGLRCWPLDGTHPGEEAWAVLVAAVESMGGTVEERNDERYKHTDPNDETRTLPGIYAYLCVPATLEPAVLHARLRELTDGWEHPVVWPELAEALPRGEERERTLARVAEVTERYGL